MLLPKLGQIQGGAGHRGLHVVRGRSRQSPPRPNTAMAALEYSERADQISHGPGRSGNVRGRQQTGRLHDATDPRAGGRRRAPARGTSGSGAPRSGSGRRSGAPPPTPKSSAGSPRPAPCDSVDPPHSSRSLHCRPVAMTKTTSGNRRMPMVRSQPAAQTAFMSRRRPVGGRRMPSLQQNAGGNRVCRGVQFVFGKPGTVH